MEILIGAFIGIFMTHNIEATLMQGKCVRGDDNACAVIGVKREDIKPAIQHRY